MVDASFRSITPDDLHAGVGSVALADATAELRWIERRSPTASKPHLVLQQRWSLNDLRRTWFEWRDVPTVTESEVQHGR